MLWQRLVFGTLMIGAVVGVAALDAWQSASHPPSPEVPGAVWAAQPPLWQALPVTALVVVLTMATTFELGGLCRSGGYRPATAWAAFVGAGLTLIPWIELHQRTGGLDVLMTGPRLGLSLTVIWVAGGLLGSAMVVLLRRQTERAVADLAVTVLMILYLGLLGSFLVRIRCLSGGPPGAVLVVVFVLIVKCGDIGAYFTGSAIGRHKLAPWVSPGKTVEGLAGAVVLGGLGAAGAMRLWPHILGPAVPPPLSWSQALIFGMVMAILGHVGDLVASTIKRDVGSKDSGRLVPSFGGLLDLLDSPLFAAPVGWGWLTFAGTMG